METLKEFVSAYSELLTFLITLVTGENGVVLLSFFAGSGILSYQTVFIFGVLAMICMDSFWFLITKTPLYNKIISNKKISNHYKKLEKKVENITHGKDIFVLFVSKVLIGTRILVILYVSMRNMSFIKFLSAITIANILWVTGLIFIGYIARGSYEATMNLLHNIELAILLGIAIIIGFNYLLRWFSKWIMKK